MAEEVTTGTATENTSPAAAQGAQTEQPAQAAAQTEQTPLSTEQIRKLVQSEADKINAELGKKYADLKKENDKLKKEKMTAEELKKYEDEQNTKRMEERERAITERENRYYTLNSVLKANIGVDNETADDIVDLILSPVNDNDGIDKKIAALTTLVNKLNAKKVAETFKANGRVPNGSGTAGTETKENNIAAELGKRAAESAKKSNEILNHYYGGKK